MAYTYNQVLNNTNLLKEITIIGIGNKAKGQSLGDHYKSFKKNVMTDVDQHMDFFVGYSVGVGYSSVDIRALVLKGASEWINSNAIPPTSATFDKLSVLVSSARLPAGDAEYILKYRYLTNPNDPNSWKYTPYPFAVGIPVNPLLDKYSNMSIKGFVKDNKLLTSQLISMGLSVRRFQLDGANAIAKEFLSVTQLRNVNLGSLNIGDLSQQVFQTANNTLDQLENYAKTALNEIASWFGA